MPTTIPQAAQQTPYPIGPPSLAELSYWSENARSQRTRYLGYCVIDFIAWVNAEKAETGIYPTFGHIDGNTRRWVEQSGPNRGRVVGVQSLGNQRTRTIEVPQ